MMFTGGWLARRARLDYLLDNTNANTPLCPCWHNNNSLARPCPSHKKYFPVLARYNRAAVTS